MVGRFRSGSGQVSVADAGRFNRGNAPTRPIQTPQSVNQSQIQRQQLAEEISKTQQQIETLDAQARANNPENAPIVSRVRARQLQVALGGARAKLEALNSASQGLEQGTYYQDFNAVLESVQTAKNRAESFQRDKIQVGIENRRVREERKLASTKEGFQETPEGFKSYGVTFNEQGKIVALDGDSRIELTPSQVLALNNRDVYNQVLERRKQSQEQISQEGEVASAFNLQSKAPKEKTAITFSQFAYELTQEQISQKAVKPIFNFVGSQLTIRNVGLLSLSTNVALKIVDSGIGQEAKTIINYAKEKPLDFTAEQLIAYGLFRSIQTSFEPYYFKTTRLGEGGLPLRNLKTPSVEEVSFIKIAEGEAVKVSNYKITSEITPPKLKADLSQGVIETIKLQNAKYSYTAPLKPIINNQPYIAVTYKKGGAVVKLNLIQGTSSKFSPALVDFAKVSRVESYTFKALLEQTRGTRLNVISQDTPSRFSIGNIKSTKFVELNVENRILRPYGLTGKQTNRFLTFSEAKLFIETPTVEIFKTDTFFKNVNSPNARASGVIPRLEGTLKVLKEPFVLDTEFTSYDLGSVSGKSNQLDLSNLLKTPVNKPIINQPVSKPLVLETPKSNAFSLVTGQKQESKPLEQIKTKNIQSLNLKSSQLNISDSLQFPSVKLESKLETKLESKQPLLQKSIPILEVKQIIKLEQLTSPKQEQRVNQRQASKITSPSSPFFPTGPSRNQEKGKQNRLLLPKLLDVPSQQNLGGLSVFVRRRKKFSPVAVDVTQQEAFRIGTNIVGNTLGATFKIKGLGNIATPQGYYRKADKEGVLFIQKNKFRLSSVGEVSEIQLAKRRKRF